MGYNATGAVVPINQNTGEKHAPPNHRRGSGFSLQSVCLEQAGEEVENLSQPFDNSLEDRKNVAPHNLFLSDRSTTFVDIFGATL
ncbi:hypothetical protein [uncultured Mobiluncus sp.]|uniref:hypothetical protein n=1 Tax=uncultured Mobiluncus sp. TaxID=293425 RepID=UPI002805A61F|nr:hypothetical protein [uncultured Mobiluncus sp.]